MSFLRNNLTCASLTMELHLAPRDFRAARTATSGQFNCRQQADLIVVDHGVDKIMFATDFPHIECEWPRSKPLIAEIYADVPENETRRIWAGNAIEFFKLKPLMDQGVGS